MSVDRHAGRDPVAQARRAVDKKLAVDRFDPPERWAMTSSWQRAQAAPAVVRPTNAAEYMVKLGYVEHDGYGDIHRVIFALRDRDLLADCDCAAHRYRGWCSHVARLWWQWTQRDLDVYDLDTGSVHHGPPWWLELSGGDAL